MSSLLPKSAEGLVQDAKQGASKVPPRIRFVLGLCLGTLLFYHFFYTAPLQGERPKKRPAYIPGPGGRWDQFDSIIALYVDI